MSKPRGAGAVGTEPVPGWMARFRRRSATCSGRVHLNSTASTRTVKVSTTHTTAASRMSAPSATSSTRLADPNSAATAYSDPTLISAIGTLSSTSRRIDPPTADTTPRKMAGISGSPRASAFVVPIAPNRPMVRASSAVIRCRSRWNRRSSSIPIMAEPVATGRYQLLWSAAGTCPSSTSRTIPPPNPVAIPMIATPSRSSRRSRNWAANNAPCRLPMPTASRSAQSGIVKSAPVTSHS